MGRVAADRGPPAGAVADEVAAWMGLNRFGQTGQARLVHVSLVVDVEEQRQLQLRTGGVDFHAPRVVDGDPRLMLAKAFGPAIDVLLQHFHERLAAAGVARPGIDAAKRNQPVPKRRGLGKDEVSRNHVARRLRRR